MGESYCNMVQLNLESKNRINEAVDSLRSDQRGVVLINAWLNVVLGTCCAGIIFVTQEKVVMWRALDPKCSKC